MKHQMLEPDYLQRFHFRGQAVRGQLVVLDQTLAELKRRRDYPEAIGALLGEMLAAVAMIADGLKWPGSVALQSKGSGAIRTSLAEHRAGGLLRAIARSAEEPPPGIDLNASSARELIGGDQLALSLIPADDDEYGRPYQGMVDWQHEDLADNLMAYFAASEQLETRFVLFADAAQARGLLLQRLPNPDNTSYIAEADADEFWLELCLRLQTLKLPELGFDDQHRFLRNLFAPSDLVLAPHKPLEFSCTCTREKTANILRGLGKADLLALLEERGEVEVVCEFCGLAYRFDHLQTHLLFETDPPTRH